MGDIKNEIRDLLENKTPPSHEKDVTDDCDRKIWMSDLVDSIYNNLPEIQQMIKET